MPCQDIRQLFDDYLDARLDKVGVESLQAHLAECPACQQALLTQRRFLDQLRGLEVPPPAAGFEARMLAPIRQLQKTAPTSQPFHSRRRRQPYAQPMWPLAAAASVLLVLTGLLLGPGWLAGPDYPFAERAHEERVPQPLRLVFRSPHDLDDVTIEVDLPAGIRLASQDAALRTVSWKADLRAGPNLLELPIIIYGEIGDDTLRTRFRHGDDERHFIVNVRSLGVLGTTPAATWVGLRLEELPHA
jgi:hypothetical protein